MPANARWSVLRRYDDVPELGCETRVVNGELAQVGALVAFGNAWINSSITTDDIDGFERTNSTFRFVRSLSFEIESSAGNREASSVRTWLEAARGQGIDQLSLIAGGGTPTAFVNQGSWGVAGLAPKRSVTWWGTWTVNRAGIDPTDRQAPIWDIRYRIISRAGKTELPSPDLARRSEALGAALEAARAFTVTEPALSNFDLLFTKALHLLDSRDPSIDYHPDLLPANGYSLDARRLVAAASGSWVFGGMGSWNDIGFSDPSLLDSYKQVSEDLYTSLIEAFRDGINSFEGLHRKRQGWLRR